MKKLVQKFAILFAVTLGVFATVDASATMTNMTTWHFTSGNGSSNGNFFGNEITFTSDYWKEQQNYFTFLAR